MVSMRLASSAIVIWLALAQPPTCSTFYAGGCPFGSSCQCTLSEPCSAEAPYGPTLSLQVSNTRYLDANGDCAGQCLQVVTGQCPGPASCVANAGACVPPQPCVSPPPNNTARSIVMTLPHQVCDYEAAVRASVSVLRVVSGQMARRFSIHVTCRGFLDTPEP